MSLKIQKGDFIAILGPSGAGKSTLLKMISGQESPSQSHKFQTNSTRTILLEQSPILLSHLKVKDNILLGKSLCPDLAPIYDELISSFNLGQQLSRFPSTLSAGEQQRVAVVRALLARPQLLLLDEPFSNLDESLKLELLEKVKQFLAKHEIAALLVTHDHQEAFLFSDNSILLIDGKIHQRASGAQIYEEPNTLQAARFIGYGNQIIAEDLKYFSHSLGEVPETATILFRATDLEFLYDSSLPTWTAVPHSTWFRKNECWTKYQIDQLVIWVAHQTDSHRDKAQFRMTKAQIFPKQENQI